MPRSVLGFFIATAFFAVPIQVFAEEKSAFFLEVKLELMSFGFGVSEGVAGLGKKSDGGLHIPQAEPKASLPITIESVPGIFITTIDNLAGEIMLSRLVVTKPQLRLPFGGTVASLSKQQLISSLGQPDKVSENTLSYYVPSYSGSDTVNFVFSESKATAIEWVWSIE